MEAIGDLRTRRPARGRGLRLDADALLGIAALATWAALIGIAGVWGADLRAAGTRIGLGAAPLFGSFDLQAGAGLVAPLVVGGAIAWTAPPLAVRLPWRWILACAALAALAWSLTLAAVHGVDAINGPLENRNDYLASVPLIDSAGDFLRSFGDRVGDYSTHVRSHPPAMVLGLIGLDRIGLGGSWPAAAIILVAASTTVVAAMLAVRAVAGERAARRAAPFLVLAPAAVWIATTADALFMAVGAWAVALIVLAITADRGGRADILAAGGGLLFGLAAFLSFGLVLLALIPAAVAAARHRLRPLALAAVGAGVVAFAFLAGGYWWLDGYAVARDQYRAGIASTRPYGFFLVSDVAAFALALGPATALGLARLRDRSTWLLVGGGLAIAAAADLSGASKGEVERIWLPFLPWVLLATTALPQRLLAQRALLGAQLALALAIEVGVATIW